MTEKERKRELRRLLTARSAAMDPSLRRQWGEQACRRLLQSPCGRGLAACCSRPPRRRSSTPALCCAPPSCRTSPSFCQGAGARTWTFSELRSLSELRPGAFGLLEPPEGRPLEPVPGLLAVVPAMACDKRGIRLGKGGGYYDRFLSGFEGVTACLVLEQMLFDALPREPHDAPVRYLFTQQRTIDTSGCWPGGTADTSARPHGRPGAGEPVRFGAGSNVAVRPHCFPR